jgi:hypothetical protein
VTTPQTITPERQIAAMQAGTVFNSMTQYLQTLAHAAEEDGKLILTEQLNEARKYMQIASFWAVQHILAYGVPKPKAAPSNVGEVVADLTDAPTGSDALPPMTPAESI